MRAIEAKMNEIRQRFVRGILANMPPHELRAFVTGFASEDEGDADVRRVA